MTSHAWYDVGGVMATETVATVAWKHTKHTCARKSAVGIFFFIIIHRL